MVEFSTQWGLMDDVVGRGEGTGLFECVKKRILFDAKSHEGKDL